MIKAGQVWRYRRQKLSGTDERYLFLVKKLDENDLDEQFWEVVELGQYGGTNHFWLSEDNEELTLVAPSSSG